MLGDVDGRSLSEPELRGKKGTGKANETTDCQVSKVAARLKGAKIPPGRLP